METFLSNFKIDQEQHKKIIAQLKIMFVERLNIDREPENIPDDEAIFNKGLELDSVDALEIIVNIERLFKIKIKEADLADSETIFQTLSTATDFILLKIAEKQYIDTLKQKIESASVNEKAHLEKELQSIEDFFVQKQKNSEQKIEELKQKYSAK